MTQEEFKKILDKKEYSYKQDGKWLIVDEKDYIILSWNILDSLPEYILFNNPGDIFITYNNLKILPENIIFNNHGNIKLFNNNLESLPQNIYFGKNVKNIYLTNNDNMKLKYYSNCFSKFNTLYSEKLINNLQFEKLISLYCESYGIIKNHQTPHICLINVLEDNINEKYVTIKLPKNFLSISSWI